MQNIMTLANTQTMTSVEVVEVINTLRPADASVLAHHHFMNRCERVAEELAAPLRGGEYLGRNGRMQPCYLLDKRTCLILVASESPKVMAAIIDRWQELEEAQQRALPQTHIEAVRAYLETLETVEAQKLTLVQQMGVIEDQSVLMDTSKQWFTISRVKPLNPTMTFSGTKLTQESIEHGVPYKSLYAPYNMNTPNTYREDIWRLVYPEVILPLNQ